MNLSIPKLLAISAAAAGLLAGPGKAADQSVPGPAPTNSVTSILRQSGPIFTLSKAAPGSVEFINQAGNSFNINGLTNMVGATTFTNDVNRLAQEALLKIPGIFTNRVAAWVNEPTASVKAVNLDYLAETPVNGTNVNVAYSAPEGIRFSGEMPTNFNYVAAGKFLAAKPGEVVVTP